ncbi:RNA methyltransferase [Xylariaceae sp. FL0804]|nr:RNA methyltransferase [Xylariaceae sp. FL0804]
MPHWRSRSTLHRLAVFTRAASLSAIHRGLRNSEKAKSAQASRYERSRPTLTSRQRRDPDWTPPGFTLHRGKKDVSDKGPQPKSRQERFMDETESFGKKSFVYKMKKAERILEARRADTPKRGDTTGRGNAGRISTSQFMEDFHTDDSAECRTDALGEIETQGSPEIWVKSQTWGEAVAALGKTRGNAKIGDKTRTWSDCLASEEAAIRSWSALREAIAARERAVTMIGPEDSDGILAQRNRDADRERGAGMGRDDDRSVKRRWDTGTEERPPGRPDRPFPARHGYGEAAPTSGEQRPLETRRDATESARTSQRLDKPRVDGPVRIQRTTAASQFLYGREVVKAALKNSRRQLYRLYIYGGPDRDEDNRIQDRALEALARQKDIPVTRLQRDGLPLLDKMSDGRPHNGCVIEASTLPQLPVKALAGPSEDAARPGFRVEPAYQSAEEALVNGTSDLVGCRLPPGRHPLVLLLDGILDPGNLGGILRTAAFLGASAVAVTRRCSARLTPAALKASAGASEVLALFSVDSAADFLARSREAGWQVYAAMPAEGGGGGGGRRGAARRTNTHLTLDRLDDYDPLGAAPTVLALGSEGEGLARPVRLQADFTVSIPSAAGPLARDVDSLNVSVAAGVLCAALLRDRSPRMVDIAEDLDEAREADDEALW